MRKKLIYQVENKADADNMNTLAPKSSLIINGNCKNEGITKEKRKQERHD